MPDPVVVGPVPNPDGTTSTTTTTFYANGSTKEIKTEIKRGDEVREETIDELRRGRGPGNDGTKRRSTRRKFDDQGHLDERTETELGVNGTTKTKEDVTHYDDEDRLDDHTETEFDAGGVLEKETRTENDDENREIKQTETAHRGGRKTGVIDSTTDYGRRPPRREVVVETYCPERDLVKERVTRVYYKPAAEWREEPRERKEERWNCRTGEKIAFVPPETLRPLGNAFALATIALASMGWLRGGEPAWLAAVACAAIAGLLHGAARRAGSKGGGELELDAPSCCTEEARA